MSCTLIADAADDAYHEEITDAEIDGLDIVLAPHDDIIDAQRRQKDDGKWPEPVGYGHHAAAQDDESPFMLVSECQEDACHDEEQERDFCQRGGAFTIIGGVNYIKQQGNESHATAEYRICYHIEEVGRGCFHQGIDKDATQDERCAARFSGKSEYVENFMRFTARHLREIMARLGFRSLDEMRGRSDLLMPCAQSRSISGLDFSA